MKRLEQVFASPSPDLVRLLFTAFFEQGMEACLLTRPDGSILAGNDEALRLFGYSNEELQALGRSAVTVDHDKRLGALVAQRSTTGKARGRITMRRKSGETFEAEISSTVFTLGEAGECATIVVRDLTEILRAEAMKRASEERLGFTLEAAHIGHWDADFAAGAGFRSKTLFAQFGLDAEPPDWTFASFLDFVHPDDRARIAQAYHAAFRNGTLYDEEFRVRWPDGSVHWLWARGTVRFDDAGRPRRMLGIQVDISERQRALMGLRESEQRFRTVADAAPVMIFMTDAQRRRIFSNRAWLDFTGRDPVSADGLGWQDLLHPDDLRRVWDEFAGVFDARSPYRTEYRMRDARGEYRWIFVDARPRFDGAGAFLGYIGICVDITPRKLAEQALAESESRHRFVLDHLSAGVVLHRTDSSIALSNAAAASILGLSQDQMLGKAAIDPAWCFVREDGSRMPLDEYPVMRVARTGTPLVNYLVGIDKPGAAQRVWVLCNGNPKIGDDGTVEEIIISFIDITALRQAESTQRELETQLRESQKMEAVGTMAGGIAHDFNNIVGTILGNAELARGDLQGNAAALQSLDEIVKAGRRARDLVSQILSFSRRQPTSKRVLRLSERIAGVVSLLRSTLLVRSTIDTRQADDVPNILADPVQVDQVLINLVTNAAQALEGRSGHIEIALDATTIGAASTDPVPGLAQGRYARVTVRDDGPGMDDRTLARIFEPFFTTKAVGQGTGLGLAVVYGIMRAHGGAVVARSTPGAGTTFHLYFPATTDEPACAPDAPQEAPRIEGRSRHVLYIDDDESLAILVRRLLERRGFRVTTAIGPENGLAGLRAAPSSFDLLVTDYNMAGMNGLDVAREALGIRPDLPVAIASGFITDELRRRAARLGIHDVIFKPNAVEEYCEVVNRLASRIGRAD